MQFVKSSYWGTWSRVLGTISRNGLTYTVELNLTAINPDMESDWQGRVAPGVIRAHGTPRERGDILTDTLPDEVYAEMVKHLGEGVTAGLVKGQFDLKQVNWDTYFKICNGGARWDQVVTYPTL